MVMFGLRRRLQRQLLMFPPSLLMSQLYLVPVPR